MEGHKEESDRTKIRDSGTERLKDNMLWETTFLQLLFLTACSEPTEVFLVVSVNLYF